MIFISEASPKILFSWLFSFCFSLSLTAQDVRPLKSKGPVPKEFISPAKGRYEQEKNSIEKNEKSKTKKIKTNFFLQSNYQLDYILKSGKVVFNEEVSVYLKKVAALLIKNNPNLSDKIKIYPIKYDFANAFTFSEGYIFVNIGLISRLDNEAELAFILGHEISHYTKNHGVKRVLKNQQIQSSSREDQDAVLKMSRFSRENEFDADMSGLNLLLGTKYNPSAAVSSLEMLYLSELPYGNAPFNKGYFEQGSLYIPNKVTQPKDKYLKTVVEESSMSEEEILLRDSLSSHPGIEERIRAIKRKLANEKSTGYLYLVGSESEFKRIRDICRYEIGRIYAANEDYVAGFYHNFLLSSEMPNSAEITKNKCLLLAKLSVDAHYTNLSYIINNYKDGERDNKVLDDEEAKIKSILEKLSPEEFHLIALKQCFLASKRFPKNNGIKELSNLLIKNYKEWYGRNLNEFEPYASFSPESIENIYTDAPEENNIKDKNGRIKKAKQRKKKYNFEYSFAKFALSDLVSNDSSFVSTYNSFAVSKVKSRSEDASDDNEDEEGETINKNEIKSTKKNKEKAKDLEKLGANKVLVFDPQCSNRDYRKGSGIDYIGDEKTEQELVNIIKVAGERAKIDIQFIVPNEMKSNEIDLFNDYCTLKNWILESAANKEHTTPSAYSDEVREIVDRYDTRYVTLVFSRAEIYRRRWTYYLGSVYVLASIPPLGAFLFVKGFFPKRGLNLTLGIFDLKENKLVYYNDWEYGSNDSPDLMKSRIYAVFKKIKMNQ